MHDLYSVPNFIVTYCGGESSKENMCDRVEGGPTSPEYFLKLFEVCRQEEALSVDEL